MDYWPVERVLRDVRINLIIEGTSEIMHLFIAREALDPHLNRIKPLLSGKVSIGEKWRAAVKMGMHYALWYPTLWLPALNSYGELTDRRLVLHMQYVDGASKKLARFVFHTMMKYQKKLESKQIILNRMVDIGVELFAMAAACSYADALIKKDKTKSNAVDLADLYCHTARERIQNFFKENVCNHDRLTLSIARKIMAKEFEWMEDEIIK